jgi:DNA-binding NarL/FixJ family response regulator
LDELGLQESARRIRIVVCDDHDLIRHALRSVIDSESDMEVVGEAADGEAAVELVSALRPDAVVMDISMPKLSGIEATERIKRSLPETVVLVLTVHEEEEFILRILEAGANGYITKGIITREMPNVIRSAVGGESILSEEVLKKLLEYTMRTRREMTASENLGHILTPREIEMLKLVAQGAINKSIGRSLGLSENTVKKCMMAIFAKLRVNSRSAAVSAVRNAGLLDD